MNQKVQFKILFFTVITLLVSIFSVDSYASDNTQKIFLTGKITNSDFGRPIVNHKIYVTSESVQFRNASYSKILTTDEEGFYYDTLTTSLNKGSFQVYTYDGNNQIQEQKLYFRFNDLRSSNIFIADFSIYMPYQPDNLQANFNYLQKNEDNRFMYQFFDQTVNENINTWQWDFGDDTESREQNPEHTFSAPGLYKINLTVKATINGQENESSFSKYVYVSELSYYHLGGHCFAGYFPIDKGKAFLYSVDEYDKFIPFDTSSFDTLGYYYFYEVPEGDYCIKVQPESTSEFYGKMVPTYYGNKVFWESATHISHHQTNWEYDIHLVEGHEAEHGFCRVSGNVAYGDTLINSKILPAQGVDLYLMDESGNLLLSHYSDNDGNFRFETIDKGNYSLTVDIPGFKRRNKPIELNDENPEMSNLEIVIENGDVNMGVENELVSNSDIIKKTYPNPASNELNIEVLAIADGVWTIEIKDIHGSLLQTQSEDLPKGNSTIKIDISSLKSGMYILLVNNEGKTSAIKQLVSK